MKKKNNFIIIFATFFIFFVLFISVNSKNNELYEYVVVDLIILNDKTSSLTCPLGYKENSGCDDEKCDLNYKAGGNYIYLCQKKCNLKNLI